MWSAVADPNTVIVGFTPTSAAAPGEALGSVIMTITGTGFQEHDVVWLYYEGQPAIRGVFLSSVGSTKLTVTLDTSGWCVPRGETLALKVVVARADLSSPAMAEDEFILVGPEVVADAIQEFLKRHGYKKPGKKPKKRKAQA